MPETKPHDYPKRQLTQAADACRNAAKLREPTSDELGRIADTTGRSYASMKSKLLGLNLTGWTAAVVTALLTLVLPPHAGNIALALAPIGIGFAIGATASLAVLEHYVTGTRHSDGRKR